MSNVFCEYDPERESNHSLIALAAGLVATNTTGGIEFKLIGTELCENETFHAVTTSTIQEFEGTDAGTKIDFVLADVHANDVVVGLDVDLDQEAQDRDEESTARLNWPAVERPVASKLFDDWLLDVVAFSSLELAESIKISSAFLQTAESDGLVFVDLSANRESGAPQATDLNSFITDSGPGLGPSGGTQFLEGQAIPAAAGALRASNDALSHGDVGSLATNFVSITAKFGVDIALMATGLSSEQARQVLKTHSANIVVMESLAATQPAKITTVGSGSQMQVVDGKVLIQASSSDGDIHSLSNALEALGLTGLEVFGNVLNGWLPIENLSIASEVGNLQNAFAVQAWTNVGSTQTQGDAGQRSDDARANLGLDGTGITIGVLSDSYNQNSGAAAGIASGDLPGIGNSLGNTTPVNVLDELNGAGVDEGRAMIELIHDIVPGADFIFHTAFEGAASFAQGIQDLIDAGADIIVDDVGYFTQPFFQDGIIAQAADAAVAQGVPYFSSAGNQADQSYEATFNATAGLTVDYAGSSMVAAHDFDAGAGADAFNQIVLAPGQSISVFLQWDEPFNSISPGMGAVSDFDLLLYDASGTTVLASSIFDNIGGDAVEGFTNFTNTTGSDQTVNLAIARFDGTSDNLLKYIVVGETKSIEYETNSSTSFGHPNGREAQGVGAAPFFRTPEFGVTSPELEAFSSLGGTPILFDTAGSRLTMPETRQGVDFVAADNTNTTFFGEDISEDADTFPNFAGTSAAAPHAAAAAAQLLQLNPAATPHQIFDALKATAIDITSIYNEADPNNPTPIPGGVGVDDYSGAGLIDANAAANYERVLITEIMYDPNSPEDDWEWVEIFNYGFSTIDLSTWVLDDDDGAALASANLSGTLAPNESAILYNAADVSEADFLAAWGQIDNLIPVAN